MYRLTSLIIVVLLVSHISIAMAITPEEQKFLDDVVYAPKSSDYRSYDVEAFEAQLAAEAEAEASEGTEQFSFKVVGNHYKNGSAVTGIIVYDATDMETVHAELVDTTTNESFTAVGTWLTKDELRVARETEQGPDNAQTYILTIVE